MNFLPIDNPRFPACLVLVLALAASINVFPSERGEEEPDRDAAPTQRTGIDPTDIRTRVEAAYTYNDRADETTRQNINLRLEREFRGRELNVRFDIPYISADIPSMSSQDGLGDIAVRVNYRYKNTRKHSAVVAGLVTLDTASEDALGDGTTKLTGVWVNSWRQRRLDDISGLGGYLERFR